MGEVKLNSPFKIDLNFQLGPLGEATLIGCQMNSNNNGTIRCSIFIPSLSVTHNNTTTSFNQQA